jgi:anti-sigma factor RsiW
MRPAGSRKLIATVLEPQLAVTTAADELKAKGYRLIHEARTEPWTQITARLLSPEGLPVAVCHTPQFHDRPDVTT